MHACACVFARACVYMQLCGSRGKLWRIFEGEETNLKILRRLKWGARGGSGLCFSKVWVCCIAAAAFSSFSLATEGSHHTAHTEREVRSEGAGPGLQVCGLECEFSSLPFFFNVIFCLVPTFCLLWGWYVWKCVWGCARAAAVTNYDCFSHMQHSLDAIRSANCESCHPLWVILIQKGQLRVVI